MTTAARTVLIVDAANVVGSVPDGWWRDRRGAAERLRDRLAALPAGPRGKWAVLAALSMRMSRRGVPLSAEIHEKLQLARIKIESGCFSTCEINCVLAFIEGQIISKCHLMDSREFMEWSRLLSDAMQGKLDYERIGGIPALEPIRNECRFLGCRCAEDGRPGPRGGNDCGSALPS